MNTKSQNNELQQESVLKEPFYTKCRKGGEAVSMIYNRTNLSDFPSFRQIGLLTQPLFSFAFSHLCDSLKKIGLISDTHGYLDENVFKHFETCDEVWHAGDFGPVEIANRLRSFKPLKGVFGNIDGQDIRSEFPEQLIFDCEEVKVLIRHIGGYPPKYNPETKKELLVHKPQLFVCGHSHILKIMYDEKINCLHINPGAAGKQGWQKVRTIVRFEISGKEMKNCEVIELGK